MSQSKVSNNIVENVEADASTSAAVLREIARLQSDNAYLKTKNLRTIGMATILTVSLLGIMAAGFYVYPKNVFIATKDNAAICGLTTETAPRVNTATLIDYARDASINAYTYDYVNYRENINDTANKFFTEAGHKAFMKSLDVSGNLDKVIKGRYILKAVITRTPQVEESGIKDFTNYWIVTVPLAIEFYAGGESAPKSRQDFFANVTIVQVPLNGVNWRGIGVDSIVLTPMTGPRK